MQIVPQLGLCRARQPRGRGADTGCSGRKPPASVQRVRGQLPELLAVSGLHALWSPSLNTRFDVRVYMDMDEGLRRFLKLRRDVNQRGHAPECQCHPGTGCHLRGA